VDSYRPEKYRNLKLEIFGPGKFLKWIVVVESLGIQKLMSPGILVFADCENSSD